MDNRLRREKVLKELNSRLTSGSKAGLSVTGQNIPLQSRLQQLLHCTDYIYLTVFDFVGTVTRCVAKPSRIPTPEATSRPLPSLGYVADGISSPHACHPRSGKTPLITTSVQSPHVVPSDHKPMKTITVQFHAIPTNEKQLDKASFEKDNNIHVTTQSAAVKPSRSSSSRLTDTRKRKCAKPKAIASSKRSTLTKHTRTIAGHKLHNTWAGAGRLNELRIRLASFLRV